MYRRLAPFLGAALLLLGLPARSSAVVTYSAFTIDSVPGDPVGIGETEVLTSGTDTFNAATFGDCSGTGIQINAGGWVAVIRPETGGALTAGETYPTTAGCTASTVGLQVMGEG